MKFLPPKTTKILIIIAVILFALGFLKDLIIQSSTTIVLSKMLDAPVKIKKLSCSLIFQKLTIKGLRIYNPKGFPNEELLNAPEITAQINLFALAKSIYHLKLIVVDIKELTLIKNAASGLNVDSLKIIKDNQEKKDHSQSSLPEINFKIDLLKLNIGQVIYKDYSKGENPIIQVYDIDLKGKSFKDIKNLPQMVTLILFEAIKPTAIKKAGLYAAATIMGVGFIPVGIIGIVIADDNSSADFPATLGTAFNTSLKVIQKIGEVKKIDKAKREIRAKVYGCDIFVQIQSKSFGKSNIKITARKYLLAKPQIASGILYQIAEQLK